MAKKKQTIPLSSDMRRVTGLWETAVTPNWNVLRSDSLDLRAWNALQQFGDDTRLLITKNTKYKTKGSPTHNLYAVPSLEKENKIAEEEAKKNKPDIKSD